MQVGEWISPTTNGITWSVPLINYLILLPLVILMKIVI